MAASPRPAPRTARYARKRATFGSVSPPTMHPIRPPAARTPPRPKPARTAPPSPPAPATRKSPHMRCRSAPHPHTKAARTKPWARSRPAPPHMACSGVYSNTAAGPRTAAKIAPAATNTHSVKAMGSSVRKTAAARSGSPKTPAWPPPTPRSPAAARPGKRRSKDTNTLPARTRSSEA
jgi:hypothetical protein